MNDSANVPPAATAAPEATSRATASGKSLPVPEDLQTVGSITTDDPLFSCRDVNVFYGEKQAIKSLSIDVGRKQVLAMIGPSGCGKSTFLRCLNRMNDTIVGARVEGRIMLDGNDIHDRRQDVVQLRARVGMVFQKPNPVPEVDLRERRVWPAHPRSGGRPGRAGRDRQHQPAPRRAVGGGQGPPRATGHQSLGRPAAAALHRAHDRGQP